MDELPNNQNEPPEPTVIIKKSFFQTTKGKGLLAIAFALILFIILFVGLNYRTTNLTGTPVKITLIPENYGFKAGELTFSCPLESAFCETQRLVSVGKNPAVGYKAASESSVLNSVKIDSLENIAVLSNPQAGKKYFYESVVSKTNDSCYTIAYTLPSDATFGDLLSLPILDQNATIATLGIKTFEIEGQESNVIIQVRNTPMDPGTPCSLIKKSPEFFKAF